MKKEDYVRLDPLAIGDLVHARVSNNLKICTVIKAAKLSPFYGYRIEAGKEVPLIALERYKGAIKKLSQEPIAI